jgi:hypothetical protein
MLFRRRVRGARTLDVLSFYSFAMGFFSILCLCQWVVWNFGNEDGGGFHFPRRPVAFLSLWRRSKPTMEQQQQQQQQQQHCNANNLFL